MHTAEKAESGEARIREGIRALEGLACGCPLALIGPSARLVWMNPHFGTYVSSPFQEAIGRHLGEILKDENLAAAIERVTAEPRSAGFEAMVSPVPGSRESVTVEGWATYVPDLGGHIVRLRTPRTELEVLARRVEAVSGLTHNMRSSLTTVRGFSELLVRNFGRFGEEEQREFLGYILQQAMLLERQVDDLAAFVYFQSGRTITWPMEPVPVERVVRQSIQNVSASHPGAIFQVELQSGDTPLVVSERHMVSALSRILENAVVFGGVERPVFVAGGLGDRFYEIQVTDRGPGMTEEELKRALLPFYTGRTAKVQSRPRSGLGLTVAGYLLDVHGGRLEIESALGHGTTVTLKIPIPDRHS